MTVTELKKSPVSRRLTEVYIDYEYAFSLYENELREFGISNGKSLDTDTLDKILKKLNKNATNDALKMLSRSDYTGKMVADKLLMKKYPPHIVKEVTRYVCERGFVDDLQYARDFVKSAFAGGKGRKYVEFELKKRGIDEKEAEALIGEFGHESNVRFVADKKLTSILKGKEKPDFKDYARIRDYLIRQGFDFDEVSEAISYVKGKFYD